MRKKFTETKAKLRENIALCPWKNAKHGHCTACECRKEYLTRRTLFWDWHENTHNFLSHLRAAAECDTGR